MRAPQIDGEPRSARPVGDCLADPARRESTRLLPARVPRPPREALWLDREIARVRFPYGEPVVACSACGATHEGVDEFGNRRAMCRGCAWDEGAARG